MITVFKYYSDWLLPALVIPVMTMLLLIGSWGWSLKLIIKMRKSPNALLKTIISCTIFSLIGQLLLILSPLQENSIFIARIFGFILLLGVPTGFRDIISYCRIIVTDKNDWQTVVLFIITVLYLFISLSPPTDSDSFDYHLSIPLLIQNYDTSYVFSWPHLRTIGTGEFLNYFGFTMGVDNLGAALQWMGLLLILIIIDSFGEFKTTRWIQLCIASTPALLFLIPSQKHQLLPEALMLASFYFGLQCKEKFTSNRLFAALGMAILSMGHKYSFYLPGAFICIWCFFYALRSNKLLLFCSFSLSLYLLLLFPQHLYKFFIFSDPISPLLASITDTTPLIKWYLHHLQTYSESKLPFPLFLIIPTSFGKITTTIGMISVLWIAFLRPIKKIITSPTFLFIAVLLMFLLLFTQNTSRFFLTPFLWMIIYRLSSANACEFPHVFKVLISGQIGLKLVILVMAFFMFTPGIINSKLRNNTLLKYAYGHAANEWLNSNLPKNAKVLFGLRNKLTFNRDFYPIDSALFGQTLTKKEYLQIIKKYQITHVVLPNASGNFSFTKIKSNCQDSMTEEFSQATRNIFNKSFYKVTFINIDCLLID